MTLKSKAYEEIIDFIAAGHKPEEIADFQASDALKRRIEMLINKEKEAQLTQEEKVELDHYMVLEHIMRLAKIRARKHLRA